MDQSSWFSFGALFRQFLVTPSQGALTQLYTATSLEVEEKDLKYVLCLKKEERLIDSLLYRAAYLVPYGKVGYKTSLAKDSDGKLGAAYMSLCEKLIANAEKS